MSKLTALIRNESNNGWTRYHSPNKVIMARHLAEVLPALEAIEASCAAGLTAVGYVAYEAAPAFDSSLVCHEATMPLLLFGLYEQGEEAILPAASISDLVLAPEIGKPDWILRLQQIKNHLRGGDTYQVNFTQRLSGYCDGSALQLFSSLYEAQPSRLAAYLQWDDISVCSVSPELFFALDGNSIAMEPMKGTRPRSNEPARDVALREELLSSDKERAENLMIVDMARNDLSRIAESGSVEVQELFRIIELPTVWQQVSRIRATTTANLGDLFRALFPCASITGAPKANTMKIIRGLETSPRGVYTGALGVVRPHRKMQFSVAIRTLVVDNRNHFARYGVGSGIVWDSDSDSEWQETLLKSRVLNRSGSEFELLETMRFEPGTGIARLNAHLDRLQASAAFFAIALDRNAIAAALQKLESGQASKARLLVSQAGEFSIELTPVPDNPKLVQLRMASFPVDSRDNFLRHKTTQRKVYEAAKTNAQHCDDVILYNERGELTETTIYNLYLELEQELYTPARECGLLCGIFRQSMLESGKAKEAHLTREDLQRATRLFVSNSVRGLCEAELLTL